MSRIAKKIAKGNHRFLNLLGHSNLEHEVTLFPVGTAKQQKTKKDYDNACNFENNQCLPLMFWTTKRIPKTQDKLFKSLILFSQSFHNLLNTTHTNFLGSKSFTCRITHSLRGATQMARSKLVALIVKCVVQ